MLYAGTDLSIGKMKIFSIPGRDRAGSYVRKKVRFYAKYFFVIYIIFHLYVKKKIAKDLFKGYLKNSVL